MRRDSDAVNAGCVAYCHSLLLPEATPCRSAFSIAPLTDTYTNGLLVPPDSNHFKLTQRRHFTHSHTLKSGHFHRFSSAGRHPRLDSDTAGLRVEVSYARSAKHAAKHTATRTHAP